MADEAQVREILAPALEPTFFDFNFPFGLSRWLLFVFGLALSALGILFGLSPYNPLALAVVIYFFGYMLAASFPSAVVIVVRNLRNLSPGGTEFIMQRGRIKKKHSRAKGLKTKAGYLTPLKFRNGTWPPPTVPTMAECWLNIPENLAHPFRQRSPCIRCSDSSKALLLEYLFISQ